MLGRLQVCTITYADWDTWAELFKKVGGANGSCDRQPIERK